MAIFGGGYLGGRVARSAVEAGAEVTALTRNPAAAAELTRIGVRRVVTSELQAVDWHSSVDPRQDFAVDCVSSAGGGLDGYRQSYLEGMRSILRWAAGGFVGTVVFTSSTSVYAQDHGEWVTEDDPAEGAGEGGAILRQAEDLLRAIVPGIGRAFILRLGGIYGPGRHRLLDLALSETAATAEDVFLNSIHVDDAASAVLAAFLAGSDITGGIFNIVDDRPAPKSEVLAYLRGQVKLRGLTGTGRRLESAGGRRRGSSRPNRRVSNRKARAILGWKPAHPDYRAGYEALLSQLDSGGGTA